MRFGELEEWLKNLVLDELGYNLPMGFPDVAWLHAQTYAMVRYEKCEPLMRTDFTPDQRAFLMKKVPPFWLMTEWDDPALHLRAARAFFEQGIKECPPFAPSVRRNAPVDPHRNLRIGFFSSHFGDGDTIGDLSIPVIEQLDPSKFEIFGYNLYNPDIGAPVRRANRSIPNLRFLSDRFTEEQLIEMIENDEVDILVDLNGITGMQRPAVLGSQPAPILVNWLGYPGTLGSSVHHYVIGDEIIIPKASERFYSERVIRLPCYHPNDRARDVAPAPKSRREAGLPDDAFVFCNFGRNRKITEATFLNWMKILRGAPRSVLWLVGSTPAIEQQLRARASAAGVSPERLVFAPFVAKAAYLANYQLADLFLDTSPFSCPTTAADALGMGVPVLTCPGRSYIARACASVVTAAGLAEFICETPGDLVKRAIEIATADPASLGDVKDRLIASRETSPLFDIAAYARNLEDAFLHMRDEYLAGRRPTPNLLQR